MYSLCSSATEILKVGTVEIHKQKQWQWIFTVPNFGYLVLLMLVLKIDIDRHFWGNTTELPAVSVSSLSLASSVFCSRNCSFEKRDIIFSGRFRLCKMNLFMEVKWAHSPVYVFYLQTTSTYLTLRLIHRTFKTNSMKPSCSQNQCRNSYFIFKGPFTRYDSDCDVQHSQTSIKSLFLSYRRRNDNNVNNCNRSHSRCRAMWTVLKAYTHQAKAKEATKNVGP